MSRYNSEWDQVNLSDPNSIKGLLKFRYRFDLLLDDGFNRHGLDSNCDLADYSEDILCVYADLDNLINKANFNKYQKTILNLYTQENTEEEIADILKVEKQSINSVIDKICDVLCELNYQDWKLNYVFWDKVKVKCNYKKCSKCKEFLPATEGYFYKKSDNADKLHNKCIKCHNS